ncbi:hypothetical protein PROPEN_00987 [Proteus penneri ATCC 35198]|nr:hypothetical protein PROPEN_00987 [Proteus penneri ATCC 35198]
MLYNNAKIICLVTHFTLTQFKRKQHYLCPKRHSKSLYFKKKFI